ncbi:hypothetical protein C8R43DRAFT_1236610 [Mycena crocata]|nr:hypothetical protein C8R43DRAFT_1236610 [Mycena crocata]
MPGNRCSNCLSFNSECTHNLQQPKEEKLPRRKRTLQPRPISEELPEGSVLETAKSVVDGLLRQTYQAPQDRDALIRLLLHVSRYARKLEHELGSQSPSVRASSGGISPKSDGDAAYDDGIVVDIQKLPEHFKRITPDTANGRFFGKHSSILLIKAAFQPRLTDPINPPALRSRRTEFWTTWPWEVRTEPHPVQKFPPPDLLRDLVDIYFTQVNIFNFILHRPTFERSLADGLHLRDHKFGATVLALCALASKNSHDKRVLLPGQGELSAGWEWFRQIQRPFSGHIETATLYDMQLCCLFILFQQTASDIESCWLISGIGILHAQDIGAHKLVNQSEPANKTGLSIRSLLFLSVQDALCSACFGRPRVSKSIGCDLSLQLAYDEESWQHLDHDRTFKESPEKPALFEYNVAYIKLINIFTFSWRPADGHEDYTGQKPLKPGTIEELDERFSKWAKEIPEHLLWNPYMEDDTYFDQSASLYAAYYHVQILVHRPFLQGALASASAFKSLAICANAARSTAHVADVKSRRGFFPSTHLLKVVFDSAVVLLLNISGGARYGLSIDTDRELVHVYKCMALLRSVERRLQLAGRFYDILCELMNASNLPLSVPSSEGFLDQRPGNPESRVPAPEPESSPNRLFSLPMGAEDLGRLPIYDSLASVGMDILEKSIPGAALVDAETMGPVDTLLNMDAGLDVGNASNGLALSTYAATGDAEMSGYLSHWLPYWSSTSTLVQGLQAMQNSSS